ncbi:MAG: hypothetical protein J3K34DRAFT_470101 [Monoraphidium minutum]|nr:MAG: hypothetical protein J3K34DRAFT_470101 [Monoraphidium minutum]
MPGDQAPAAGGAAQPAIPAASFLDPAFSRARFLAAIAAQPGGQALVRYFGGPRGKGRAAVAAPGGGPGDNLITIGGGNGSLTHCACVHGLLERVGGGPASTEGVYRVTQLYWTMVNG